MTTTFTDIDTLLRYQASCQADAVAIATETDGSLAYGELYKISTDIAQRLSGAGIGDGNKRPRIGIVLPNGSNLMLTLLGTAMAGEATPFNPASTASEFDAYFQATRIEALIVGEDESGPPVAIAETLGLKVLRISLDNQIIGFGQGKQEVPTPKSHDIALVLMTSGSTGQPKIVPLTHGNICTSAAEVSKSMNLSQKDRCLCMWEQHHIGGLVDLLLTPLASGGSIIATSGFNATEFYRLLGEKHPTWFQGVPTTLNELMFHAEKNEISVTPSSLRLVRSVAAALPERLMAEIESLFCVPVLQTLGMTEAGPLITSTALPPAIRKPGSVGKSCGTEIQIVGKNGEVLDQGKSGEVAIRGDNVFSGYENDETANAGQFHKGWFFTGDTGYFDDEGDLFLTGRIKQLINRGGEKINPQEVDDTLLSHPAVAECATFAVKHRTLGEDVAVAVMLRTPVDTEILHEFLASKLASFKLPQRILVLDKLPRNPVGKIDRLALAENSKLNEVSRHIAPRNELETFVADIWVTELNIDNVGVHDDFSIVGGDSLSSIRIAMAIEAGLDAPIPDDIFSHFSTVESVANFLAAEGIGVKAMLQADGSYSQQVSEEAIADIFSSQEVDALRLENDPDLAYRSFLNSQSRKELRVVTDAMVQYCSPSELIDTLNSRNYLKINLRADGKFKPVNGLRMYFRRARWNKSVRREIAASNTALQWKRDSLSASVFLYGNPAVAAEDKTLVIGITGKYMRLMMPTYRILCNLNPEKVDLLLLNDPSRSSFLRGLENVGNDLDAVVEYADKIARDRKYQKIISLGTSGGGLPAIFGAVKQGWDGALAVCAVGLASHKEIAEKLRSVVSELNPEKTKIAVSFAQNNIRDADAAAQLSNLIPTIETLPDSRYDSHNLLNALYDNDELREYLEKHLQ